jgi:hypothetical protein
MDDAFRVRGVQRIGNFNARRNHRLHIHRPAQDGVLQRHTIEELHHDKRASVLLANIVNCANVGMVQRRRRLRFTPKTAQGLRIFGDFVGQELQRHEAIQSRVLGLINDTHPSAA